MDRRRFHHLGLAGLAAAAGWALAGCGQAPVHGADDPADGPSPPRRDEPLLSPWRTVPGGFLAPPSPAPGLLLRPGTGMFVKLVAPTAVALRGSDLLVLDAGSQRLWRIDTTVNTLSGIAGAPTAPGVALALGPDGSAWVLDPVARQVLRFGRDARLLQTFRIGVALPSPVALALADGGATLLLGDGLGAQWSEQRGPGGLQQAVAPAAADGQRLSGVDGLAVQAGPGGDTVWVLDRLGGAVHRSRRDGRVLETLGRGALMQPQALVVDRFERAFVVDQQGRALVCLRRGQPPLRLGPAELGVQQIGGLAVDDRLLALTDALAGQVVLHRLGRPAAP